MTVNSSGTTTKYLHHDRLGSIRAVSSSTGGYLAKATYDPYGKKLSGNATTHTNFGYGGQYTDPETGLQYLRARYYDPSTAQFLTHDPATALTRDPYGYAERAPLDYLDPSGLSPCGILNLGEEIGCLQKAGHWVADHSGDFATGVAIGVCFASGEPWVCAALAIAASASRDYQRYLDCGYITVREDVDDAFITSATLVVGGGAASAGEKTRMDEFGNFAPDLPGFWKYAPRAAGSSPDVAAWLAEHHFDDRIGSK
jgi:RHS repeat-associated protein